MKRLSFVASLLLMAGLVLPSMAGATASIVEPGTLIKTASSPAVYYVDADLTRHAFPNSRIFNSWFEDFGGVQVVSDETMASLPLGSSVPYKAGKRLVKLQTDPRVYAVDDGGVLRWVKSEQVARALYGALWNKFVDDLPDSFFASYSVGEEVDDAAKFDAGQHRRIKDIAHSLRAERLKKHQERGGDAGEFENDGFGRDKVALCHSFGDHGHTIYVAAPAKPAHLAHGDTIGRCASDESEDEDEDEDEDDTAPVMSDVRVSSITQTGAKVLFDTDEDAKGKVFYSTATPVNLATAGMVMESVFSEEHELVLTGLHADTTYYLVIKAFDADGNIAAQSGLSFKTLSADTTAPAATAVTIDGVTDDEAVVHVTANEEVKIKVYYSTVSPVAVATASHEVHLTFDDVHVVELDGLVADTAYYVLIVIEDEAGNDTTLEEETFTTDEA